MNYKKYFLTFTIIVIFASLVYGLTSVAVISPSPGQNVSGDLLLNATTDQNATNTTFYFYDSTNGALGYNITIINDTANDIVFNTTIDTSSVLTDGLYNITVNSTNSSGITVSNATITGVTIDNNAPSITLVNSSFNTSDTTPSITFNYSDSVSATASCVLYFDGAAYNTNSSVNNATNTILTANTSLSENTYFANVNCTDGLNNEGNSSTITIIVDATNPVTTINSINSRTISGQATGDRNVTINYTVTDIYLTSWNLSIFNSSNSLLKNFTGTTNQTLQASSYNTSADGNYTINMTGTDSVGNSNTSTFIIAVDITDPLINSLSASASSSTAGTLTVNSTDVTSGIANCTYADAGSGNLILSSGLYSATLSGLTASTAYTVNVTCTDNAGNTQSNTTASFTTSAAAAASTSSGGGGSAASQVSGKFSKVVWASVKEGETAIVEVKNGEIGVTEITFTPGRNLYGMWMKVERVDSLPTSMKNLELKTYKFVEITKSLTFKEGDIVNPKIDFKVEKSWLTDNKLAKDNIALFRYVDGEWVSLTTTLGEDDGTYVHYTAETPGFSYFAIAQKEVAEPVVEETVEEVVKEETAVLPGETVEEITGEVVETMVWPWVALFLIIVLIGVVSYFVWKNKNPSKKRR
jgi:PGF-pre-PGF domain-containing protein